MKITTEDVFSAYLKLKQEVYHDKTDLFLRFRLARFGKSNSYFMKRGLERPETEDEFNRDIEKLRLFLEKGKIESEELDNWLKGIGFKLLPKSVSISTDKWEEKNNDGPVFITNQRTDEAYNLTGVEYFIDAPIEIHIISVLWCMRCGHLLERNMDKGVLANRLSDQKDSFSGLFKMFHHQYSKWRNNAITTAQKLHERKKNVAIISLDIKKFFYHLKINWNRLESEIRKAQPSEAEFNLFLTKILKKIHLHYWEKISDYIQIIHEITDRTDMVPIGLKSSAILSNWALNNFDCMIREEVNPEYYGRYCDDILIVLRDPNISAVKQGIPGILEYYFSDIISQHPENNKIYELAGTDGLTIQEDKLIVQYFDKNHSAAGIKEFARQIARVASEFRFLPEDELDQELDQCAFDIQYRGSINKLRSVVGIFENSTELARYLGRQILAHRLCKSSSKNNISSQLTLFYQGRNAFDFCRLWERVFTFLIIDKGEQAAVGFAKRIEEIIKKMSVKDGSKKTRRYEDKIKADVKMYLYISIGMPVALLDDFSMLVFSYEKAIKPARTFRKSNLLRHDLVAFPLLNYTSFAGNLNKVEFDDLKNIKSWIDEKAFESSPRFIHFDECQIFCWAMNLFKNNQDTFFSPLSLNHCIKKCPIVNYSSRIELLKGIEYDNLISDCQNNLTPALDRFNFLNSKEYNGKIKIGVANINVPDKDIEKSYIPDKSPNLSFDRQSNLYELINCANNEDCDLLVLPEVSVPHHWLPFMVAHARKSQMGMVFGVEHCVVNGMAYNFIATILPFKDEKKYKSAFVSLRLKNHYAPGEIIDLKKYRLGFPEPQIKKYEIFRWRGVDFSVFNCFELADIKHRSIMRSRVDFVVASIWNKDVNYYSSIVESACRDIHCYVVQVNTSKYGDSRITQPTSKHEMNLVQVKGGENTTLLTCSLDINKLRDHQIKEYGEDIRKFKPSPPGFESEEVIKRSIACAVKTNKGLKNKVAEKD